MPNIFQIVFKKKANSTISFPLDWNMTLRTLTLWVDKMRSKNDDLNKVMGLPIIILILLLNRCFRNLEGNSCVHIEDFKPFENSSWVEQLQALFKLRIETHNWNVWDKSFILVVEVVEYVWWYVLTIYKEGDH